MISKAVDNTNSGVEVVSEASLKGKVVDQSTASVSSDSSETKSSSSSSDEFRVNPDKKDTLIGKFPYPPQSRKSLLEMKSSEGFLNLFGLLLVVWSGNVMYHNWRQSGQLIDFTLLFTMLKGVHFVIGYWFSIVAFSLIYSVLSEFILIQFAQKKRLSPFWDGINCTIYALAQLTMFAVPTWIVFNTDSMSPLCRSALGCQTVVNSFKMHSYFITNRYFREEIVYEGKYAQNGNKPIFNNRYEKIRCESYSHWERLYWLVFDFVEYVRIPSLVYEIEFPRTDKVDYRYVAREYGGGLLICLVMYLVIQRHISPFLQEIETYDWYDLIINLTIPSMIIWMLTFYCVFHCFMNATAEMVRYADREFYLEWWSATSVSQYWRLWNRPVLKFMSRHIYVESMRRVKGFNKFWAATSTFFVTAALHEFVLIYTFRVFRPYFFCMVISQIPLFYVTEKVKGTRFGNVILWFGYMLCFPCMELLYFRASLRERGPNF
ncbi:predicted protein [Naegleria gruberi]|uniref:O-acyltransferase n=1 Tax=Naegleria gruberi TaxID=5762 RepID=D2VMI6_NAEGR|nr:uncharacterized protein NAEGRDRAFT_80541 [Naegleria gruberi]EFC42070.1 predicted protein [Naegleria gruberi]|eukprot:XP_002674814.1 predicted protein [Naegleria gruberi strain NEG-M]